MERIYHIRARSHGVGAVLNNGGATVHLERVPGDPLHLRMRVAYCNPTDVFCKKLGRQQCLGAPAHDTVRRNDATGEAYITYHPSTEPKAQSVISIRNLPSELGRVWRNVHRRMKQPIHEGTHMSFDHRLREWLPRD